MSWGLPQRVISTLCPKRLRPSDCIDLSGLLLPTIALPSGRTHFHGLNHDKKVRFPPNTRGFLYYHTPPKAPPFVGELRLRCANSLEDFPNGTDLLSTDKFTPWSMPLSAMATQTNYLSLRGQLMLDDLASQTTLDTWVTTRAKALHVHKSYRFGPRRPILYYFRQPFLFRFDSLHLLFHTATKDQIGFCVATNPIWDHRFSPGSRVPPYSGKLSSQFSIDHIKNNFIRKWLGPTGTLCTSPTSGKRQVGLARSQNRRTGEIFDRRL